MLDIGCPRCVGELNLYSVIRGFAARCDGCDGLLVDDTALSSITGGELVARTMPRAERSTHRDFVLLCEAPMKVIHAKGVELDVCTQDHWIWLDDGEMARFRPGLRDQAVHDSRNVVISQNRPVCSTPFSICSIEADAWQGRSGVIIQTDPVSAWFFE